MHVRTPSSLTLFAALSAVLLPVASAQQATIPADSVVIVRPQQTSEERTFNQVIRAIFLAVFLLSAFLGCFLVARRRRAIRANELRMQELGLTPQPMMGFLNGAPPPPAPGYPLFYPGNGVPQQPPQAAYRSESDGPKLDMPDFGSSVALKK